MISFTVPGIPEGKGRHRTRVMRSKSGAAFARQYADPRTVTYEAKVADSARLAGVQRIEGPVVLHVVAVYPSRKKTKRVQEREPKTTKPDGDNILKAIADALIGVAYDDDAVVTSATVEKHYGATGELPHVEVRLEGKETSVS